MLSGCILLLPVIERNQAAEAARGQTAKKPGTFDTGIPLEQQALGSIDREAQAFVALHSTRPATRPLRAEQRLARLLTQLRQGSEVARTHAATDIGMMGLGAKTAVDELSYAVRYDNSKWVRRSAVKSLAKISGPEVVAPLEHALQDRDRYVAHSAKNALRKVRSQLGARAAGKKTTYAVPSFVLHGK